ncbi:MAG TPA: cytochrome c peroxidase [Elusimicrobiota bacterium]|nr:cytochrome c peroxidase [Elusimicrobiota bacterium]
MKSFSLFALLLSSAAFARADALPAKAPEPADNPSTPAKLTLGRALFYDTRLSAGRPMSCISCHDLSGSGENNRPNAELPDGKFSRHAVPTVWNAAFLTSYFWSGGAASLEEQSEGPLTELGLGDPQNVVARIASIPGYAPLFAAAFGDGGVTLERVEKALGAFERTLLTPNSPYDRFVGGDAEALPIEAQRGMTLFAKLGCASCHAGAAFAGASTVPGQANRARFPVYPGSAYEKKYGLIEPGRDSWRVAPLRNIARTAPYFHNGSVPTLDEAVRVMAKTQLNRELSAEETAELVAFLDGLSGELPRIEKPRLPE